MKYTESEMNSNRAEWAENALRSFEQEVMAGANEDDETILSDLLANFMHFCQREGLEFNKLLATAYMHFEEEAEDGQ